MSYPTIMVLLWFQSHQDVQNETFLYYLMDPDYFSLSALLHLV